MGGGAITGTGVTLDTVIQGQDPLALTDSSLSRSRNQRFGGDELARLLAEAQSKDPDRFSTCLAALSEKDNIADLTDKEKRKLFSQMVALEGLDKYLRACDTGEDTVLREPQVAVVKDIRQHLETDTSGYVKLPTGSGKTVVFSKFTQAAGLRTMVVVPTQVLIDQTDEKLEAFAGDLDRGKICAGEFNQGDDVTVITYASLVRRFKDGTLNPADYDCVILDEAHIALGEENAKAVERLKEETIVIGFTATPEYSEKKHLSGLLGTCIHSLELKEAIEMGMLCPVSAVMAKAKVDLSNVKINAQGEYDEDQLEKAINVESVNSAAVKLIKQAFPDQKAVVFCGGVDHAKDMARRYKEAGIAADWISGEDSPTEQKGKLDALKNGEIKVLCNARILTAGFDDPSVSVCLNLVPTASKVLAEQRAGRVLRLFAEWADKLGIVVDFVYSDSREGKNGGKSITFPDILGCAECPAAENLRDASEKQREALKEKLKALKIEGLEVVADAAEVMKIVAANQSREFPEAPQGWLTKTEFAGKCGFSSGTVAPILDDFREGHPEYFDTFRVRGGKRVAEHYSSELIDAVLERLPKYPPPGWLDPERLAEKIGLLEPAVRAEADKHKDARPEWFKRYRSRGYGRLCEHYSPEFVEMIEKAKHDGTLSPAGWPAVKHAGTKLNCCEYRRGELLKAMFEEHPEWCIRENGTGEAKYVSPQAINLINRRLREAAERKVPVSEIAEKMGVSPEEIAAIARDFVRAERFSDRDISQTSRGIEYSTPFIDAIERRINEGRTPPAGWLSQVDLEKAIRARNQDNSIRVAPFFTHFDRRFPPEWRMDFRTKLGTVGAFYSPEFVEYVDAEVKKQLAEKRNGGGAPAVGNGRVRL